MDLPGHKCPQGWDWMTSRRIHWANDFWRELRKENYRQNETEIESYVKTQNINYKPLLVLFFIHILID